MKDKRTYRERAEYFRAYRKRWHATERGKQITRRIWAKQSTKRYERRVKQNEYNKKLIFKNFIDFFGWYSPVSIVCAERLMSPNFIFRINGLWIKECLFDPLPDWIDESGEPCGGGKWDGKDFI